MKTTSIQFKLLVFVFGILILGTIAVLYSVNKSYKKNVRLAATQSIINSQKSFANLIENDVKMMRASLDALTNSAELRSNFSKRDTASLFALASPIFIKMKADAGISHWYFLNPAPDTRCFLRVHNPKIHSDVIARKTYLNAITDKTFSAGLELGKTAFALRAVMPYMSAKGDSIIGYMELGEEIEHFLISMKTQTENEYGLLIKKEYLNENDWASVRKTKNLENNWNVFKDVLLVDLTTKDEHLVDIDIDIEKLPDEGKVLETISNNEREYVKGVFPIYDTGKQKVGAIFLLHEITKLSNEMRQTELNVILSVLVTMLLIILLLTVMLNKLIIKRLNNIVSIATRVVGGDFESKIQPSSTDEIGQFESLFEQFRQVFVNLMKELEELQNKK